MSTAAAQAEPEPVELAPLSARRTQLIVAAALEVFAEHGLGHARLSDIAGRAGVSMETLIVRFGDTDAIAVKAIHWIGDRLRVDPDATLPPGETNAKQLERLVLAVMEQAIQSEALTVLRLLLADGGRYPELGKAYDEAIRQPNLELARLFAERLSERGKMHAEDEDAFVAVFEGFVRGELEPALLQITPALDAATATRRARAAARRILRAFVLTNSEKGRTAE